MKINRTIKTTKEIELDIEFPFYCLLFSTQYMKVENRGDDFLTMHIDDNKSIEVRHGKIWDSDIESIKSAIDGEKYYKVIAAKDFNEALERTTNYFMQLNTGKTT